jgi:hypothetical protein
MLKLTSAGWQVAHSSEGDQPFQVKATTCSS